jgi:hypothetical protein
MGSVKRDFVFVLAVFEAAARAVVGLLRCA